MKKTTLMLCSIAALSCINPVHAVDAKQDGNVWHNFCNGEDKDGRAYCGMFVIGYLNGALAQATFSKSAQFFCFPNGAVYQQAADVFSRHLANRPERRHLDGAVLLTEAMMAAFPCSK